MATYNLPAVVLDKTLRQPTGYGRWDAVPNLNALAESLAVGSDAADAAQLKSIPDVWAQAQIFQQALLEPHPLHDDVEAQWRGLLALFALQPEFSTVYDLEVVPVDLKDSDPRKRFRAVLRHLLPATSLSKSRLDWRAIGCVLFRERAGARGAFARSLAPIPIGFLSPTVLVAAGRDAHLVRCAALPWLAEGLGDPTRATGLLPRHYEILAVYLDGLGKQLQADVDADTDHALLDRLIVALQAYHEACVALADDRTPLKSASVSAKWPSQAYAMLGRTQVLDADKLPEGHSDCKIAVRPEAQGVFKGLILVDPAIAETFGRAPEAITVWGQYSLKDAANAATLEHIRKDAEAAGYVVVQPGDFFTHELVAFTAGTEIEAHGRQGFDAALMPFSPLVLLVFRPDTLAAAADLSVVGEDHQVGLRVVLPSGKQHSIRKAFGTNLGPQAAVQLDEDRPDDLAIWPNFTSRQWRWNYLHYQCNPKYEVQPRFAISGEFLAEDLIRGTLSAGDRIRRLSEWDDAVSLHPDRRLFGGQSSEVKDAAGRLMLHRLRFADTENLIGEFQRLPRGVEAIFFARRSDGEGTERPVGLALVRPRPAPLAAPEATVAIDFGTTNTVAYEAQGGTKTPVVFEDRLLFPIRHTQKEAEQRERLVAAYTQFFPLKRHETPFPTVAKRRELRAGSGSVDEAFWAQLQAGHEAHGFSDSIFFVPQFDKLETHSFLDWTAKGILVFGIKWARGEAARRLTRRFLRQVMMMCAAELADRGVDPRSIKWRFSHPQAFNHQDREDLKDQIVQAWAELFESTVQEGRNHITMETEGAAAAHYFMFGRDNDQVASGKLMLMFDIGGGTTDVALWQDDELKWRNSFRLAGGDFFTRYLANNISILEKIDFSDVATSLTEQGGGKLDPDVRLNFVELFVNAPSFSRNFESNFSTFSMEPAGAGLRQCASVAVGGIFYYVGLVLKELAAKGVIDRADLTNLTLAFAGRGSALLRYFDRGPPRDTPLHRLGGLVAAGAELDPQAVRIDTLFSAKPKHEVALGLLTALRSGVPASKESRIAPIGEPVDVSREGKRAQLSAGEDVRQLLGAGDPRAISMKELLAFAAALKKQSGIDLDLRADSEAMRQIQQSTGADFRRALREMTPDDVADDTQLIEPLFITELRALVNLMNLPIARREELLSVKERVR